MAIWLALNRTGDRNAAARPKGVRAALVAGIQIVQIT